MSLREKILSDLKAAMKEGDAAKRDVLRLLDSAIKNSEIEKKKREEGLSEEEVLEVLSRAMKQRQDSVTQFEKGSRPDLAEKEKQEMAIISVYLPEQLSQEEVEKAVREIVAKMGEISAADFGKVMGQAMGQLKGKADGNAVSKAVKAELGKIK
ncbi:MAG: GatB/YqeY domain-containing protein [Candidatus Moranbacteria bacterium GW2011_GWE1_49_15]|nr:MAG: GatB/YqeY domain-containing protein [Candidatus Moranbacteria bacterium GW2011_GWE2_47_10]KKW07031.1 MAG: GatB/YqeY domain-containing protein [Candidatus Moranbacteria bacterium GW2011_GWE1_49_15]HBP01504.1 glutamyl-tRNA amidotransferase [Candidatus Moranbacteria bacterium]